MIQKKESLIKNREQFKNSQLKLSLDKPVIFTSNNKSHNPKISFKHIIKDKDTKREKSRKQKDLNNSASESATPESIESKTTELNPIFIQSLLKESKLKVILIF